MTEWEGTKKKTPSNTKGNIDHGEKKKEGTVWDK